jgi:hypothetical protein
VLLVFGAREESQLLGFRKDLNRVRNGKPISQGRTATAGGGVETFFSRKIVVTEESYIFVPLSGVTHSCNRK